MNVPGELIDNGGVRIEWDVAGDGPPLLMIHGLGYARAGWGPLLARLRPHFRLLTFDNRGIGASAVPPGPYSALTMATDAVAVLDAAGVERAHVLGTSLGGMIAQELAIGWPDRVDRLVLLSTSPGRTRGAPMPTETAALLASAADLPPGEALRRFVVNALGAEPSDELVDQILAMRMAAPQDPAGWEAQAAAGVGYDGGDRAAAITHPTLVVTGDHDRVVDPANSTVLSDLIPDASLLLMPGGHLMFWEHPAELAAYIVEFLR